MGVNMSKKKSEKPAAPAVDIITAGQVMVAAKSGDMATVNEYKRRAGGKLPAGVQAVLDRAQG